MKAKDIDRVGVVHNDSRHPGRIFLDVKCGTAHNERLDLSVADTAVIVDRLLSAIRMSGFDLAAKPRSR